MIVSLKRVVLTCVFSALLLVYSGSNAVAGRPNILWIITDDQRPDSLQVFNQVTRGVPTSDLGPVLSPNIDQLAAEGVLFPWAYCNSPACAPSRASMHTGQYPFRNGVYGFDWWHSQTDTYHPLFPQILSAAGYTTANFGKFHVQVELPESTTVYDLDLDYGRHFRRGGYTDFVSRVAWQSGVPIGHSETWYLPDGTEETFLVDSDDNRKLLNPEDAPRRQELLDQHEVVFSQEGSRLIVGGVSPLPAGQSADSHIADQFIKYLENAGGTFQSVIGEVSGAPVDAPLFVHLSFHFPHTPVLPPQEFRSLLDASDYTVPEFSRQELERLPAQLRTLHERANITHHSVEVLQQAIRDYYAFCAYGDAIIGRAINAFKDYCASKGEDYLIIYVCGDHSWHLGEHGIMAKFGPYEQSNRQAVIVAASNTEVFAPGTVYEDLIEFVDFAPTILTAAGVEISAPQFAHLDGYPLQRVVDGSLPKRDYVLGSLNHVYGPRAYIRNREFVFSMRTRPWNRGFAPGQNMAWGLEASSEDVEMALFDLRIDPKERFNLAYNPEYAALAEHFRQKLASIVLGDRALEVDWTQPNRYYLSTFAVGADDKQLRIPPELVPQLHVFQGKYSTGPFALTGPASRAGALDPEQLELTWDASAGATLYRVQISEREDMSDPVVNQLVTATSYRPLGLEYGQTYYWQVEALPELLRLFGEKSTYNRHLTLRPNTGGVHQFATVASGDVPEAPVITRTESVFGEHVLLRWDVVPYANRYRIYRRKASEEDWELLVDDLPRKTTEYLDGYVLMGESYVYGIAAINERGIGSLSETESVTLSPAVFVVDEQFSSNGFSYPVQMRGRWSFVMDDGRAIANLRALFPHPMASVFYQDVGGPMYRTEMEFRINEWKDNPLAMVRLRTSIYGREEYQIVYWLQERRIGLLARTAAGATTLDERHWEFVADRWHRLRLQFSDGNVQVFLDGEHVLQGIGRRDTGRGDMELLANEVDLDLSHIRILRP